MMEQNKISGIIIDAAITVHRELGPGLLESVYEECLAYELTDRGLSVLRQQAVPIIYREIEFECGYRLDLFVEERVIVELKAVEEILPIHKAQLATYMKLAKVDLGLLLNFNVPLLKDGIVRWKL
jgi:GxxExxY protein